MTVKDLTAGDKDFYSESKGFSVTSKYTDAHYFTINEDNIKVKFQCSSFAFPAECLQPHPFNLSEYCPACINLEDVMTEMSLCVSQYVHNI